MKKVEAGLQCGAAYCRAEVAVAASPIAAGRVLTMAAACDLIAVI
jgi:hypothetical protein